MEERRTTPLRLVESTRRTPRNTGNPSIPNHEGCTPRLSNLPPSLIPAPAPWRRFQIRRPLSIRLPSPLRWSPSRCSPTRRSFCASIHSFRLEDKQTHDIRPRNGQRKHHAENPGGGWTGKVTVIVARRTCSGEDSLLCRQHERSSCSQPSHPVAPSHKLRPPADGALA